MKRPKKGPELKMPELKVPDFLSDLYWDLRDRRLLPLVALAIVAIVAVPFLLGGDSKEDQPANAVGTTASALESVSASKLTVVEAQPGLRDYRRRLRGRSATDPFRQRFTAPTLKGTKLGGGEGGGGGGESSTTTSTSTTTTSTSTNDVTKTKITKTSNGKTTVTTETNGEEAAGPQVTLYAFAIDIKITRTVGSDEAGEQESETRHRVIPPAPLPSEKEQVVTYMGLNPKTRQPLLLVSDEVTSVFGEGKCLAGAQSCQLIEIEPGFPETFVFGAEAMRFKIEVLKIEPVAAGNYHAPE